MSSVRLSKNAWYLFNRSSMALRGTLRCSAKVVILSNSALKNLLFCVVVSFGFLKRDLYPQNWVSVFEILVLLA